MRAGYAGRMGPPRRSGGGITILDTSMVSLPSYASLTRASTATNFNPVGTMVEAGINEARFDHNPATLAPLGLLVEGSRTNVYKWSTQIGNADGWGFTRGTGVLDDIVSPDGLTKATRFTQATNTFAGNVGYSGGATVGLTYTTSVYAKAGTSTWMSVNSPRGKTYFDLVNGVVGNIAAGDTARIENAGNGWWRCIVIGGAALSAFTGFYPAGGNGNDTVPIGNTFYVWGAQLELGTNATSLIYTTTTAVTRSFDFTTFPTSAIPFNTSQGTIIGAFRLNGLSGIQRLFQFSDGTVNNRIAISAHNGGNINFFINTGGSNQFTTSPSAVVAGTLYKVAFTWSGTRVACCANSGTVAGGVFSGSIPTGLTIGGIGCDGYGSSNILNGTISQLTYLPYVIPTDAQLQALTA